MPLILLSGDTDHPFNPSAEEAELDVYKEDPLDQALLVAVSRSSGKEIEKLMAIAEANLSADVMVSVESELSDTGEANHSRRHPGSDEESRSNEPVLTKILYLNGHPLLNTRLLV